LADSLCRDEHNGSELIETSAFRSQVTVPEELAIMPEIEIPEPSPRDRTTLLRLRARQCRYVVSDASPQAIFCGGATEEGSSWCPWHRRLVYARPPLSGAKAGRGFASPKPA
jgi:hypothetical protein